MMSRASSVQPPRIAVWLVGLFTPDREAESIPGDLLEEFSNLASNLGVPFARRWYWRQSVKTIAHLFGAGLRAAPWSTGAAVAGGYLLGSFVHGLPDKVLSAVTDRYLGYWSNHFKAYMFWATDGMWAAHLILSVFVGCMVAFAAKGRELVATMTLAIVLCTMVGVAYFASMAKHWPMDLALSWILFQCSGPFASIVGAVIVRTFRSAARVRLSGAN
jgi:hypothetical protein